MTTIRRSFDASEINPILNDPYVFNNIKLPGMKPGDIDATSIVDNLSNVLLMSEGGGILFVQQEPGIYDVHTSFLKPERGQKSAHIKDACLAAYKWMFTRTDCMVLQTKAPDFNRAVIVFAPLLGWRLEFERKSVWPMDGGFADMSYFSLRYEDWVKKNEEAIALGKEFHRRLDEGLEARGIVFKNHEDDQCHELYVGACIEMIYGGQPEKAVALYNRWARFSGYAPISVKSLNPLIVDIGTACLLIEGNNFTVIKCQQQQP